MRPNGYRRVSSGTARGNVMHVCASGTHAEPNFTHRSVATKHIYLSRHLLGPCPLWSKSVRWRRQRYPTLAAQGRGTNMARWGEQGRITDSNRPCPAQHLREGEGNASRLWQEVRTLCFSGVVVAVGARAAKLRGASARPSSASATVRHQSAVGDAPVPIGRRCTGAGETFPDRTRLSCFFGERPNGERGARLRSAAAGARAHGTRSGTCALPRQHIGGGW